MLQKSTGHRYPPNLKSCTYETLGLLRKGIKPTGQSPLNSCNMLYQPRAQTSDRNRYNLASVSSCSSKLSPQSQDKTLGILLGVGLTGLPVASTSLPVMFRLALVATACVVRGSSTITVLRPEREDRKGHNQISQCMWRKLTLHV